MRDIYVSLETDRLKVNTYLRRLLHKGKVKRRMISRLTTGNGPNKAKWIYLYSSL